MSAFHCWNWAVYETTPYLVTHPSTRSHIHKHTHGCKCVFWRWKSCLYSFVVSGLRINQITAMAAASPPPPPPHSCSSNRPPPLQLVDTGPAGAQVALEGAPAQSAGCRCCSRLGCVSPKRPRCQETRHITAGVTLKPTERNENPWTPRAASHMLELWANTTLLCPQWQ